MRREDKIRERTAFFRRGKHKKANEDALSAFGNLFKEGVSCSRAFSD